MRNHCNDVRKTLMSEWSKSKKVLLSFAFWGVNQALRSIYTEPGFLASLVNGFSVYLHCILSEIKAQIADSDALCKWCLKQWWIQDFPEVGAPTLQGASTYNYAKFSQNCMKLKEFGPGGRPKFYYVDPSLLRPWGTYQFSLNVFTEYSKRLETRMPAQCQQDTGERQDL